MREKRNMALGSLVCAMVAIGLLLLYFTAIPVSVRAAAANFNAPPFDFSDRFYTMNGLNVQKLNSVGRVGYDDASAPGSSENGAVAPAGVGHWIADAGTRDPNRANVRVLQTTGGFDKDGKLIYYSIMAPIPDQTFFTQDEAGARALGLADEFQAFIFPKQNKNGRLVFNPCPVEVAPGTPAASDCVVQAPPPGNRRQDNLFETKDEYFCNNLLGLWKLALVVYTPQAINTHAGQVALAQLAAKNGVSLDGTPVLKTEPEIVALQKVGDAQILNLPAAPHAGAPRWVV